MAEIQMTYRVGRCRMQECGLGTNYCEQCHTSLAEDTGCRYFNAYVYDSPNIRPYGDCVHAVFDTKWKGVSTKNYEIEEINDNFYPEFDCALVHIGKKVYECTKVILDGVRIYPAEEEEDEQNRHIRN